MYNLIQSRIASVLIAAVGIWLLISPLFISITGGALISTFVVGGVLAVTGAVQFFWENTIPSWASGLTTVWMGVSAVVFNMSGALLWSTLLAAAAALVLAMWDGVEIEQIQHHNVHA